MDFKEEYDSARREVLYKSVIEFWVPMKLVKLMKMFTRLGDTAPTALVTSVNMQNQYTKSTQLSIAEDRIPISENDLVEDHKCVMEYECKDEQYSSGEEKDDDMLEKEEIKDSLTGEEKDDDMLEKEEIKDSLTGEEKDDDMLEKEEIKDSLTGEEKDDDMLEKEEIKDSLTGEEKDDDMLEKEEIKDSLTGEEKDDDMLEKEEIKDSLTGEEKDDDMLEKEEIKDSLTGEEKDDDMLEKEEIKDSLTGEEKDDDMLEKEEIKDSLTGEEKDDDMLEKEEIKNALEGEEKDDDMLEKEEIKNALEGEEKDDDMLEKEEIKTSFEQKLCVLTLKANEVVAENDAIEKVPSQDELQTRNEEDSSFTTVSLCESGGIATIDSRARFEPPENTNSSTLKPGSSMALRHKQFPKGRTILTYPIPDYTQVKHKTNTFNIPKTCVQNIQVSEGQDRRQEQQATPMRNWKGSKPSKIPVLIKSKVSEGQNRGQEQQGRPKRDWKGAKPSKIPILIKSKKSERTTEDGNSAPVDSIKEQRAYLEEYNDRETKGIATIDSRARFEPPEHTNSSSSKPGSSMALRHRLFPRRRTILTYPIPDYTQIKPKTNTYNTPKMCVQNIQISDVQVRRQEKNSRNNENNFKKSSKIPVLVKSKVSEGQCRRQEQQATPKRDWKGSKPSKIPVLIKSKVLEGQAGRQEQQTKKKRDWKGAKPSKIPVLIKSKV
ncbi:adoMet-dependent rRNA methyltransferase SPB1-like [Cryptotermes secundus]|uniref:adoMet-dependent rRNA methyltransferase SPB1-like n=1 Tax=Cryptotermes secundus TaxID=105785 RepID=UPI001454B89E|nr:adoMet-dependent rRNA methyltransferase SPB1-like [Cryptotermes secundus]